MVWYHYAMKYEWVSSAWHLGNVSADRHKGPPNAAYHFAPVCVGVWMLEFVRMVSTLTDGRTNRWQRLPMQVRAQPQVDLHPASTDTVASILAPIMPVQLINSTDEL